MAEEWRSLNEDIDAIFMLPDSTVNRRVEDLLRAAMINLIPVSGPSAAQARAGALMSYGINHRDVGRQASKIAARILRDEDPGEMPVEIADYYLTLNVAAADRIGLVIPEETLRQADTIIRSDSFEMQ